MSVVLAGQSAHASAPRWSAACREHYSLNRRIALHLLRQRIEHSDEIARLAVSTAQWRIHDELVRGNPTRIERPEPSGQDTAPKPPGE